MLQTTTATSSSSRASSLALLRLYEAATRCVPRGNTNLHALTRLWLGLSRRTWSARCVDDGRDAFKALRSSSRLGARDAHLWAQWALLEAFCGGGGRSKALSVVEKGRAAGAVPVGALDEAAAAISSGSLFSSDSSPSQCCWLDRPEANPDLPALSRNVVPLPPVCSRLAAVAFASPAVLPPAATAAPTPTATLRSLNGNNNTTSVLSAPRRIGGGGGAGAASTTNASDSSFVEPRQQRQEQQKQQRRETTESLAAAVAAATAVKFSEPAAAASRPPRAAAPALQQQQQRNPPSTPVEDAAEKRKRKAAVVGDAGVSPAPFAAAALAAATAASSQQQQRQQVSLLGAKAAAPSVPPAAAAGPAAAVSRPAAEAQKRRSPPGGEQKKAASAAAPAAAPPDPKPRPPQKPREDENSVCVRGTRYAKLECVGRGGSSKVFKVMAPTRKIYALKRIKLAGRDREAAEGFVAEIGLLSRLKGCPGIVELVDAEVIPAEKLIYVVLEYGDIDLALLLAKAEKRGGNGNGNGGNGKGGSNANASAGGNKTSSSYSGPDGNFIRLYWQQMLRAVETIHDHRIVHSDLKPANFLVVKGSLKLIDFGIARAISADTTSIAREQQVGTLNYMSPEAVLGGAPCPRMAAALEGWGDEEEDIEGEGGGGGGSGAQKTPTAKEKKKKAAPSLKVGRPSDVWSLGCILYQMAYGHTPFAALPFVQKLHAITDPAHEIPFPPHADSLMVDVARRCLCRDPRRRATLGELLAHPFLCPAGSRAAAAAPASGSGSSGVALSREELAALLARAAAAGAAGSSGDVDELLRSALGGGEGGEKKKGAKGAARAASPPAAPREKVEEKGEEDKRNGAGGAPAAAAAEAAPPSLPSSLPPCSSASASALLGSQVRADLERMKFDDTGASSRGGGGDGSDDSDDDSGI